QKEGEDRNEHEPRDVSDEERRPQQQRASVTANECEGQFQLMVEVLTHARRQAGALVERLPILHTPLYAAEVVRRGPCELRELIADDRQQQQNDADHYAEEDEIDDADGERARHQAFAAAKSEGPMYQLDQRRD